MNYDDILALARAGYSKSEIDAMAAVMKRKFNFYYHGKIYQIKGGDRFSAVKYVHAFNGIRAAQNAQAEEHQSEEQA